MARRGPRGWSGVLLRGPSGVGKSDLALRLLGGGWRLVADDRVAVWRSGGRAWGAPPPVLHGLLEARGQGLTRHPAVPSAVIDLVVDLLPDEADLERLPEPEAASLAGLPVPRAALLARDASAPARLDQAWTRSCWGAGADPATTLRL